MADEGMPAKKVDEDWKRRVSDEKRMVEPKAPSASPRPGPGPDPTPVSAPSPKAKGADPGGGPSVGKPDPRFIQFLQGVAAQCLMALGQIEGLPEPDLRQAKMVIDTLLMLEEKTRGNLSREEEQAMKGILQEFQSIYVQMAT